MLIRPLTKIKAISWILYSLIHCTNAMQNSLVKMLVHDLWRSEYIKSWISLLDAKLIGRKDPVLMCITVNVLGMFDIRSLMFIYCHGLIVKLFLRYCNSDSPSLYVVIDWYQQNK